MKEIVDKTSKTLVEAEGTSCGKYVYTQAHTY